jgi:hypothetical protein
MNVATISRNRSGDAASNRLRSQSAPTIVASTTVLLLTKIRDSSW